MAAAQCDWPAQAALLFRRSWCVRAVRFFFIFFNFIFFYFSLFNCWRAFSDGAAHQAKIRVRQMGAALCCLRRRQVSRDKATNIARAMSNVSSAVIFGGIFWRMGRSQSSIQDRMGLLQAMPPFPPSHHFPALYTRQATRMGNPGGVTKTPHAQLTLQCISA
jgi:hypothetical protein